MKADTVAPLSALVLGLDVNGLAVVRALASKGVSLSIIESNDAKDSVYQSTRYGEIHYVNALTGKGTLSLMSRFARSFLLYPTTDQQVAWFSQNRALLPDNIIHLFPSKEVVKYLLDKKRFFEFCHQNLFPVSQYRLVRSDDDIINKVTGLQFPLIIKTPEKVYGTPSLAKAYFIETCRGLKSTWEEIKTLHHEFIVQEFIPGEDSSIFFCMQYIDRSGNLLASFTGRKIRQWRPGCGGTASCEPVNRHELHDLTYNILTKAGFSGIGSMEYKLDVRTGQFYCIEPTVCRTDFQEQVAVANGVNIPWIAWRDAMGQKVTPVISNGGKKAWMHVLNDRLAADYYIGKGKLTRRKWLWSLRKVRSFDIWAWQDPGPLFNAIKRKIKRLLS